MERVGFIGLGIMGKPMAGHLIRAGYPLVVHDLNRQAVAELAGLGAQAASSPREAAEKSDLVITMLPDSPDVEQVVLGRDGVIEGVRSGMLLVDMSTIAPATTRRIYERLQAKGVEALDAPVSGGEIGAQEAILSIMVGGTGAAFERALPLFKLMGKSVVHMGGPGAGQLTKACNQIMVGVNIQGVVEAMALARKSGVDPAKVRQVLLGGFAGSRILDLIGQRLIDRNFQPGFKVKLQSKDMNIALQTGRELALPLLATAQVAELLKALLARGQGELDHSALALLFEEAGV